MLSQQRLDADAAAEKRARMKGMFAGGVIVVCIIFLVWALWPTPPVVIPPASDPAAQWMKGYNAVVEQHKGMTDPFYMATARITLAPSADNTGIVVGGRVANAAQLALLKSEFEKITPAVPITWQVTLGLQ